MRKDLFSLFLIAVASIVLFASCKKNYYCQCSYKNEIKLVRDLGLEVQSKAEEECSSYDTTVTGEDWTCVLQ